MDEKFVTRHEFDLYCKQMNGSLTDIKETMHDIAQAVDRNLINVQTMFADYNKRSVSKVTMVYITCSTAMLTGLFGAFITLLFHHFHI